MVILAWFDLLFFFRVKEQLLVGVQKPSGSAMAESSVTRGRRISDTLMTSTWMPRLIPKNSSIDQFPPKGKQNIKPLKKGMGWAGKILLFSPGS